MFDEIPILAAWISTSLVLCVTPAHAPGPVLLALKYRGLISRQTTAIFAFHPAIVVTRIFPTSGHASGGTAVAIYGGFEVGVELTCDFAGVAVPAIVVNESLAQCTTPASEPGSSMLSIRTVNDAVASFEYLYVSTPSIVAIIPSHGPASGGTKVRFLGTALDSETLCCFGSSAQPVEVISPGEVLCTAPSADDADGMRVVVSMCSSNLIALVESIMFNYVPDPMVTAIYPSYGPDLGGTTVTIMGSNFGIAFEQWCQFGDQVARATVLSASLLTCLSPPRKNVKSLIVPVSVVYDDSDIHNSLVLHVPETHAFTYQPATIATSIYPLRAVASGRTRIFVNGMHFQVSTCLQFRYCS